MTAAQTVDLHTLANLPGAGRAAQALAQAGWRLPVDIPEDYQLFRVEVDVTATRSATVSIIVAAEDEVAAVAAASECDAQDHVVVWGDEDAETDVSRIRSVTTPAALQMIRAERLPFEIDE